MHQPTNNCHICSYTPQICWLSSCKCGWKLQTNNSLFTKNFHQSVWHYIPVPVKYFNSLMSLMWNGLIIGLVLFLHMAMHLEILKNNRHSICVIMSCYIHSCTSSRMPSCKFLCVSLKCHRGCQLVIMSLNMGLLWTYGVVYTNIILRLIITIWHSLCKMWDYIWLTLISLANMCILLLVWPYL